VLNHPGVTGLRAEGSARTLSFADGAGGSRRTSIVLATGVAYRPLAADGVAELTGSGVYYGSAATEGPVVLGQRRLHRRRRQLGRQAALFFSAVRPRTVTLLVRGDSLEASMSYYLIQPLEPDSRTSASVPVRVVSAPGLTATCRRSRSVTARTA
jgi:thioredoxin reductase (NADPH)